MHPRHCSVRKSSGCSSLRSPSCLRPCLRLASVRTMAGRCSEGTRQVRWWSTLAGMQTQWSENAVTGARLSAARAPGAAKASSQTKTAQNRRRAVIGTIRAGSCTCRVQGIKESTQQHRHLHQTIGQSALQNATPCFQVVPAMLPLPMLVLVRVLARCPLSAIRKTARKSCFMGIHDGRRRLCLQACTCSHSMYTRSSSGRCTHTYSGSLPSDLMSWRRRQQHRLRHCLCGLG